MPGHGTKVALAARSTGYEGPIVAQERQPSEQVNKALTLTRGQMALPGQKPDEVLKLLDQHVQFDAMGLMMEAGGQLDKDTKAGVKGAVSNFSLSSGSSAETSYLYDHIHFGWTPPQPGEPPGTDLKRHIGKGMVENLARAWNIDVKDLTSEDRAVYGPARAKFQQNLIDRIHQAGQSEDLKKVHQAYSKVVEDYEARGNSVVISAGNDGDLLGQMKIDNGGRDLKFPQGFEKNTLATPETTVVGASAVSGFDPKGKPIYEVAPYSNREGVSMYASGYGATGEGTSFAAPRVAAVMARLQRENPRLTSSQIENLARQQFADQPQPPGISVLR